MANLQCNPVDPSFLHYDQARLTGTGDNIPPTSALVVVYGTTPGGPYPNISAPVQGNNTVGQVVDNIFCPLTPNTQHYFRIEERDFPGLGTQIDAGPECTFTTSNDGGANYWNPDCDTNLFNYSNVGLGSTRNSLNFAEPSMNDGSVCNTMDRLIEWGPTAAGPWTTAALHSVSLPNPGPPLLSASQGFGGGVSTVAGYLPQGGPIFLRARLFINTGVVDGAEVEEQICGPVTQPAYPDANNALIGATTTTTANLFYFANTPAETFNVQAGNEFDQDLNNTDRIRLSVGTTPGGPYPLVFEEDADAQDGGQLDATGLDPCTRYYAIVEYLERDNGDNLDPNNYTVYSTSAEQVFDTNCLTPECSGATAITATSATLNGTGHAVPADHSLGFNYSTTPGGPYNLIADPPPTTNPGNGADPQPYSFNLTGLAPGTTYYFVPTVYNSDTGLNVLGAECQFTTLAPAAVTDPPTNVNVPPGCVTLNGHSVDAAPGCTYSFVYGNTPGGPYPNTVGATPAVSTGANPEAFSAQVCGLPPGDFYYRAVMNCGGPDLGGTEETFNIPAPPGEISNCNILQLPPPNGFTNLIAQVDIDAVSGPGNYLVIETSTDCINFTVEDQTGGINELSVPFTFSTNIGPFPICTPVCVRFTLYDTNDVVQDVQTCGPVSTRCAPIVDPCEPATNLTPVSATLNATSENVTDTNHTYRFRYGTTPGGPYPFVVSGGASSGGSPDPYSANVVGLTPGTTYYYISEILDAGMNVVASSPVECTFTPAGAQGPGGFVYWCGALYDSANCTFVPDGQEFFGDDTPGGYWYCAGADSVDE